MIKSRKSQLLDCRAADEARMIHHNDQNQSNAVAVPPV
jgi:hypothetical protein